MLRCLILALTIHILSIGRKFGLSEIKQCQLGDDVILHDQIHRRRNDFIARERQNLDFQSSDFMHDRCCDGDCKRIEYYHAFGKLLLYYKLSGQTVNQSQMNMTRIRMRNHFRPLKNVKYARVGCLDDQP